MRRTLLWILALGAGVGAPATALTVRWYEARDGFAKLEAGLAALDAPVERAPSLAAADVARAQSLFDSARSHDADGAAGKRARVLWHVAQGYADLARGEASLARQEVELATRLDATEPRVRLLAATVEARAPGGDRLRAEHLLDRLASEPSAHIPAAVRARATLVRLDLLLDAGRAHEALNAAEALDREHPAAGAVKNLLGLARAAVGDRDGARAAFARAHDLDPRDAPPLVNTARLLRDAGDLPAARETLSRALSVAPESAEAWLAYGVVLADLHDPAARHALVRAAALAPEDAAPLVAQGTLDLADHDWAGAAESFRAALARDEYNETARTNLGVALAHQGRRAAAVTAFEQATARAPHQGEAWNGLGAMRLAAGDAEGALGPLRQASVLLPSDPNPCVNLGRAFERLERWDEVARAYREALKRAPGHTAAFEHLVRIVTPAERERLLRRAATAHLAQR